MIEGFWTIRFQGVAGAGSGVLTLMNGTVFGGDTSFLYQGTYSLEGQNLTAKVQVKRFAPALPSLMGKDEYSLELKGTIHGSTIMLTGSTPGIPTTFAATIAKISDLPVAGQGIEGQ